MKSRKHTIKKNKHMHIWKLNPFFSLFENKKILVLLSKVTFFLKNQNLAYSPAESPFFLFALKSDALGNRIWIQILWLETIYSFDLFIKMPRASSFIISNTRKWLWKRGKLKYPQLIRYALRLAQTRRNILGRFRVRGFVI